MQLLEIVVYIIYIRFSIACVPVVLCDVVGWVAGRASGCKESRISNLQTFFGRPLETGLIRTDRQQIGW